MSLNGEILEILIKCDFPPASYRNFLGITRAELGRLTLDDLKSRLLSYLPPSPARSSLASRFVSALFNHQDEGIPSSNPEPKPIIPIKVKKEVKQEPADTSTSTPPPSSTDDLANEVSHPDQVENVQVGNNHFKEQETQSNSTENNGIESVIQVDEPDSDPDVEIVDEVINVSIIRVVNAETKAKERGIDHVTLEDDDDDKTVKEPPPLPSGANSSAGTGTDAQVGEETSISLRRSARKRSTEMPPPNYNNQRDKKLKKTCAADKRKANITVIKQVYHSQPKVVNNIVFTMGSSPVAGSLRCHEWTKAAWENLASHAQVVEELVIVSNCNYVPDPSAPDVAALFLPNLTTLRICHRVKELDDEEHNMSSIDINYSTQLREIFVGSPSLAWIDIFYKDEITLKSILRVIGSVPELPSLSSIYIGHCRDNCRDNYLVTLRPSELIALGKIKANLTSIHLSSCIWADYDGTEVKIAFQEMLSNFPNLEILIINGCFLTSTKPWPKITLDFPNLSHLEVLNLGSDCAYSSSFETVEERPKKTNRKKLIINSYPDEIGPEKISSTRPALLPENLSDSDDQNQGEEYFPVSINFHGPMPSLNSVTLGVLYKFDTLDFSKIPALKVFQVASQWAESFPDYFSEPTPRKGKQTLLQTSKVEVLQFPDTFKDCFIITKIMPHFPCLKQVDIHLPTVKFLRAFAKAMHTTGPKSFKHLTIETRFDFASSLDSCILDQIQSPTPIEREQLKLLKAYLHWEDYVLENQIEIPPENIEDEDGNKSCGLRVLFNTLKTLSIQHIPRTLRIPKGPCHWIDDPNPEFTDTLIGFKEYPFHAAVEKLCPSTLEVICQGFDMSEIADNFRVKLHVENGKVQLNLKTSSVKTEVKLE